MFNQSPAQKAAAEDQRLTNALIKTSNRQKLTVLAREVAEARKAGVLKDALANIGDWQHRSTITDSVIGVLAEKRDLGCLQAILPYLGKDDLTALYTRANKMQWQEGKAEVLSAICNGNIDGDNFIVLLKQIEDKTVLTNLYDKVQGYYHGSRLLNQIAQFAPENLPRFLDALAGKFNANELAESVVFYCASGAVAVTTLEQLLGLNINANYNNGAVMTAVLRLGQLDIAKRLIEEHQFETEFFQSHVYPELLKDSAPPEALAFAKGYATKTNMAASEAGFQVIDDVSVACVQVLPNNGQLTTIFNFGTGQQILIPDLGGQTGAATVVKFADLPNSSLLIKAARVFVTAGGDTKLVTDAGIELPVSTVKKPINL